MWQKDKSGSAKGGVLMELDKLNSFYKALEDRKNEIVSLLASYGCDFTVGYYNGHYSKRADGHYEIEFYPIPVISIAGLCDIEINVMDTTISTKLTKERAICFDYSQISGYTFEVYGVEDYLADYYAKGDSIKAMIGKIQMSDEKQIGFSFCFDTVFHGEELSGLLRLFSSCGFFY